MFIQKQRPPLLPEFGLTYCQIEKDGFKIKIKKVMQSLHERPLLCDSVNFTRQAVVNELHPDGITEKTDSIGQAGPGLPQYHLSELQGAD